MFAIPAGEACHKCRQAALATVLPAVMALVTALPQLTTDLVRSLPDQDVRCQKAFGSSLPPFLPFHITSFDPVPPILYFVTIYFVPPRMLIHAHTAR